MNLPFTVDQFIGVFEKYNLSIWPMQVIAYVLGIAAVVLAFRKEQYSDRAIAFILSFFWLWMGIVYHWLNFSVVNKAAYLFGLLFVLQAMFFLQSGVKNSLSFKFSSNGYAITGLVFIAYAMIVYPLIGYLLGHGYPRSPSFGVAPCPTAIFTFGLLLGTDRKVPKFLLIIPLAWSLLGFFAALKLGIREDVGLLIAGILGTVLIILRDKVKEPGAASSH